jgi:hypothetical protein
VIDPIRRVLGSPPAVLIEQWKAERKEAVDTGDFLKVTPLQRKIDALTMLPDLEVEEEEVEEQVVEGGVGFGPGLLCHSVKCPHCGGDLSLSVTAHQSYDEDEK